MLKTSEDEEDILDLKRKISKLEIVIEDYPILVIMYFGRKLLIQINSKSAIIEDAISLMEFLKKDFMKGYFSTMELKAVGALQEILPLLLFQVNTCPGPPICKVFKIFASTNLQLYFSLFYLSQTIHSELYLIEEDLDILGLSMDDHDTKSVELAKVVRRLLQLFQKTWYGSGCIRDKNFSNNMSGDSRLVMGRVLKFISFLNNLKEEIQGEEDEGSHDDEIQGGEDEGSYDHEFLNYDQFLPFLKTALMQTNPVLEAFVEAKAKELSEGDDFDVVKSFKALERAMKILDTQIEAYARAYKLIGFLSCYEPLRRKRRRVSPCEIEAIMAAFQEVLAAEDRNNAQFPNLWKKVEEYLPSDIPRTSKQINDLVRNLIDKNLLSFEISKRPRGRNVTLKLKTPEGRALKFRTPTSKGKSTEVLRQFRETREKSFSGKKQPEKRAIEAAEKKNRKVATRLVRGDEDRSEFAKRLRNNGQSGKSGNSGKR